MKHSFGVLEFW